MNPTPHYVSWSPQTYIPINTNPNLIHTFHPSFPCDFAYTSTFQTQTSNHQIEINYSNGSFQTANYLETATHAGIYRISFNDLFKRQLCIDDTSTTTSQTYHTANVSARMMNHDKTATDVYVYKSEAVHIICSLVGWLYFFAWSISFYPQLILNFKRKATSGLNFDFVILNVYGFTCYSIYNCFLYFNINVISDYFKENPDSLPPVESNDVFFSIHALILSTFTLFQVFFYDGFKNKPSKATATFFLLTISFILVQIYHFHSSTSTSFTDVLNQVSLVKVFVTLIKYIPQAFQNYRRKSTAGWSIYNILLDISGGSLSLLQMGLEAWNFDVWTNSNPTKLALGMISIVFDLVFISQHYFFYRHRNQSSVNNDHEDREAYEPLINAIAI